MSSNNKVLALRLEGPLQSWGFDSQYNRRNTGLMPTKSAIAGMCCAALGYSRGSDVEQSFLKAFRNLKMIALSIPRKRVRNELPVRRLQDYHTVGGGYDPNDPFERGLITVTAKDGKPQAKKGQSIAVLTHRQYLLDAAFGVLLEGEASFLSKIAKAIENPVWGLWLGRKTCIPTAPILGGLADTMDEALARLHINKPIDAFIRQSDVDKFIEGKDSLPDVAVSFGSGKRQFSIRRVISIQKK